MAITYGFFNSVNGDRVYNADQMSEYFDGLISDGVFESVGGALKVTAGNGMNVNVATGRSIIRCKWLESDAVHTLGITQAHPTLDRYTAIIVKLDTTTRSMDITTKDGTAAASPTKPAMANTETVRELCLAYILVKAGATSISASDIQDTRSSNLCGWITGLVKQVDTSTLFDQYSTAYAENLANMQAWEQAQKDQFEAWYETLTTQLAVNTHLERTFADTTTAARTKTVTIPAAIDYEVGDIVDVYINGILLSPTEYTIENVSDTTYRIRTTDYLDSGNTITISCLKSVIGNAAIQ